MPICIVVRSVFLCILDLFYLRKDTMKTRVLDSHHMAQLVGIHGLETTVKDMMERLRYDFTDWEKFQQIPRIAFHVPDGILELMPVAGDEYFVYKTVNGHPKNPIVGKQTVVATGQVHTISDGYPVLFCEMSLVTAIRTAAVSALASDVMARKDAKTLAIIGTGAQSEYQTIAHKAIRDITRIQYFDIDPQAMEKYRDNMDSNFAGAKTEMMACKDAKQAVTGADIILVCTACKAHGEVIKDAWLVDGQHVNGLGGDCPGKTELQVATMQRARVMVEFFVQSHIEGETQRMTKQDAKKAVDLHLFEALRGDKLARTSDTELTVFDGVGIALEDYSALMVIMKLAHIHNIGETRQIAADITDPKNLFGVLRK